MKKDIGRIQVINNIRQSVLENKFNNKVEEGDHVVTLEEREKVIVKFDNLKKNPINKIKADIARNIANKMTNEINAETEIEGLDNIKDITTGAIVTCNHFNKVDNTVVRYFINKIGKTNKFDIVVQESNMFMEGKLGWLLKNCYTLPLSESKSYMIKNFTVALHTLLKRNHFILIYPEEEMWFNYKKPRPPKPGAYHFACKANAPIIPCFIEMQEKNEIDDEGFYKIKYILHILKPIYPDKNKDLQENKELMRQEDYKSKIEMYEKVYNKKYTDEFNEEEDIAGWVKE